MDDTFVLNKIKFQIFEATLTTLIILKLLSMIIFLLNANLIRMFQFTL